MKILKKGIRNVMVITVLLSNIGCDQISKNVARDYINYGEKISVVSSYLTLTKVENSGAFLSLGNTLPNFIKIPLLTIFPSLVLIGMLVFILRKRKMDLNYSLPIAFIIGGGIGNLYDRILYGSVTDFLHMNFQFFQTGIFNMADVSIMVGIFWLLVIQINTKKDKPIESF
ncbi:signal peptidase II [Reichenbachiella ulvae]|uniref:Lipoprotein signal peptidase n=1 Tax=Reichenbachiella ulvae TaxID=2980104 RepID=A0ABT3CN08_9BACT|nr:signal peptidase II [Reichenbachiella ulvae]MCV9385100.1 signal peptidase II [Reichenbachiella ulvae]